MSHVRPRAIVDSALAASDAGLTDADNAALHDVAVTTIRRWRRDYQRLGKPRGQDQCTAQCPRCDGGGLDASAYAELLGWYLGDGHITVGRRGVHYLHVINDVRYVQSNTRIAHLLRTVKPSAQPHARSRPGSVVITAGWKHWPFAHRLRCSDRVAVSRREAVALLDSLIGEKG